MLFGMGFIVVIAIMSVCAEPNGEWFVAGILGMYMIFSLMYLKMSGKED